MSHPDGSPWRISTKEMLEHPWFAMKPRETKKLEINFALLRSFRSHDKLKKIVLTILAT